MQQHSSQRLKATNLTYTKQGTPLFCKRVPKNLKGHPQLPKTFIKQRLSSDPIDHVALLQEFQEVAREVDSWLTGLEQVNTGAIRKKELIQLAQRNLRAIGLKEGDLDPEGPSTYQERETVHDTLDAVGLLEEHNQVNGMMWELLHKPILVQQQHTLQTVWDHYVQLKKLDVRNNRDHKRTLQRWQSFVKCCPSGHNLSSETVNKGMRRLVEKRFQDGVSPNTIIRELGAPVLAAVNAYLDEHEELDVRVRKPRVTPQAPEERPALDVRPHRDLFSSIKGLPEDTEGQRWKKLFLLISGQSSAHLQEVINLKKADVVQRKLFCGESILYFKVREGKTQGRKRITPLVAAQEDIRRLIKATDGDYVLPERIRKTTESNWSSQINALLYKLTDRRDVTSYVLRHTWKACADRTPSINQGMVDRLGGWVAVSNKGARYGRGADEFDENLLAALNAQREILRHLVPTVDNVVPLSMANVG